MFLFWLFIAEFDSDPVCSKSHPNPVKNGTEAPTTYSLPSTEN